MVSEFLTIMNFRASNLVDISSLIPLSRAVCHETFLRFAIFPGAHRSRNFSGCCKVKKNSKLPSPSYQWCAALSSFSSFFSVSVSLLLKVLFSGILSLSASKHSMSSWLILTHKIFNREYALELGVKLMNKLYDCWRHTTTQFALEYNFLCLFHHTTPLLSSSRPNLLMMSSIIIFMVSLSYFFLLAIFSGVRWLFALSLFLEA